MTAYRFLLDPPGSWQNQSRRLTAEIEASSQVDAWDRACKLAQGMPPRTRIVMLVPEIVEGR